MTEIAAGTVIGGRYRLERRIGEGGMGVVWAAVDVVSGQRCAVKLVKPGFGAGDAEAPRRFVREARAASAVRHPNVVRKLDVIELDDGSPVLVMELLDGESLRDLFARERRLAVGALAELMVPVVSAVGTAHALGIVHRDLKLENVMLLEAPNTRDLIKVLDFGLARSLFDAGSRATATGLIS
ncbi:MAG TPA: serine/threonine-protein kinase, partial [Kofleriaceae bacterium]|nr:serine/threonine-protein kinase [Kofleriaceae bacterium]